MAESVHNPDRVEENIYETNIDPEAELDDPEETMLAERKAMTGVHKINPLARTFRFYMEEFVNPV